MDIANLKQKVNQNPSLKRIVHRMMFHNGRPRWWVKHILNPFAIHHGKKVTIRYQTVMNVSPINTFYLGNNSTIEEYSVIDNGAGEVIIGDYTLIGLRNTIIGPVHIGNHVILAQNIILSGLNHNYGDISLPIHLQGINCKPIIIEDDAWIAANSIITAGVTIGKHSVVAAGSVVTKNVPPFSVVAGNPAKIIKRYVQERDQWMK
ncbi:acyltransferase [Bacteroides oleiciplenus]|uniref:acyltransferase n=1 Tax=Bacteroides oleiciplenus TaxID=626931 RepID=UPI0026DCC2EB|nr:acyltransferase [Bacteroides oleiciplenus]